MHMFIRRPQPAAGGARQRTPSKKGAFSRPGSCPWRSSETVQKATLGLQTGQQREAFHPSRHAVKARRRMLFPELAAALSALSILKIRG